MNKKKIEDICTKVVEWAFLGLLLVVPLYFDTHCRGVFDIPKVTLLRLFSLVIIGAWLLRIILTNEFKFVRSKLDLPVLAFLLVSIVSTIFSVDPFTSIVGAYKRHEGLTTTICYVLLFFTATNFLHNNRKLLNLTAYVGIGVGFIASFYTFVQRAGLDPISWAADVQERAVATFGNPIFLGAYLATIIPVTIGYFFIKEDILQKVIPKKKAKNKKLIHKGREETIKSWLFGIALITMYASLFLAKSRGPLAGLLAGIILFATLWTKKAFIYTRKRAMVFSLTFLIFTGYLCLQPGSVAERMVNVIKSAKEEKGEILQKVITGEEEISESTQPKKNWLINKLIGALGSRYFIWRNSAIIIAHYPQDGPIRGPLTFPYCGLLFGVGVDTMKWVYPLYELPGMEKLEGYNVDYDRAHNEVFDMAVTRGLGGLAIYLWLLGAFIYLAIRGYLRAPVEKDKLLIAGFLSGWTAYIVQNQFAFAVVSFTPFYWTLMGMTMVVCGYTRLTPQKIEPDIHKKPSLYIRLTPIQTGLATLVVVVVCLLGYLSLFPYRADYYFNKGEKAIHDQDLDTALKMYEEAVHRNFRERHYYGELTYTYYKKAASIPMTQIELKKEWIRKTFNRIKDAFKVNPKDGYFYNILGATYALEYDVGSKTAKQKAIEAYHAALKYNIIFAEPLNNLGALYSKDNEYDNAIAEYKKVAKMRPNDGQCKVTIGDIYFKKGDYNEAINWLKKALAVEPDLINAHHRLGEIYFSQGKYDESSKAFEEIVKIDPKNINVRRDLGAAYFRAAESKRTKGQINEDATLYYKAKSEFELYLRYHPEDTGLRQVVDSMTR
ncbi:MAG: tetratricopeptide repeat protein [bacterium]